jgi:glycine C-acetyltransferase
MPTTEAATSKFRQELQDIRDAGTYNEERVITSQQDADIEVESGDHVINFCANNYLGLANHPEIMEAAKNGVDRYGFGVASVRFICGTQTVHKQLEHALSDFHDTDDTILYNSCFDANTGLFETLLGEARVGVEARVVEDRVVGVVEVGQGVLQVLVHRLGAADETDAGDPEAVAVHAPLGGLHDLRVIGEAEVIVRAEVDDVPAALNLNVGVLLRGDDALFVVGAGVLDFL